MGIPGRWWLPYISSAEGEGQLNSRVPTSIRLTRFAITRGDTAAVELLWRIAESLPVRGAARDIVVCALLWLDGDREFGGSVERWWNSQDEVVA